MQRLLIVGGGNMPRAILGGLAGHAGIVDVDRIMVLDPSETARAGLQRDFGVGVSASPRALPPAFQSPDTTLWAVKPQAFRRVAESLLVGGVNTSSALHISIMAGVPLLQLQRSLAADPDRIVRTMPNTPAGVGEGMTALYATPGLLPTHRALATELMSAVGQTTWLAQEHLLDAATALSGSGPGYLAEMAETMVRSGMELGLTQEQARQMVAQTFKGAGAWMAASPDKPLSQMAAEVTSPGGTTQAAREAMRANGVHDGIRAGVRAAYDRSLALGDTGPSAAAGKSLAPSQSCPAL